jgi:hypothetical protein
MSQAGKAGACQHYQPSLVNKHGETQKWGENFVEHGKCCPLDQLLPTGKVNAASRCEHAGAGDVARQCKIRNPGGKAAVFINTFSPTIMGCHENSPKTNRIC